LYSKRHEYGGYHKRRREFVEISGVYIIPAAKQAVWEALIDPTLLEACIPGCEAVQQVAAHKYTGKITGKVGPIKAGFTGDLILTNLNPPDSYTMNVNGPIDAENTRLAYTARTELEGLLAKIAARLVTGTAIKYLDQFFDRFSEQVVARRDAVARID